MHGNRQLIAQALANLMDNAVKYTPRGGRIDVSARGDRDEVRLVIDDSGPGIPCADRERVLKRFVRLDSGRHIEGAGLGLSLVAAVAHLHGAGLELSDAPDGLRVVLTFRRATTSDESDRTLSSSASALVKADRMAAAST